MANQHVLLDALAGIALLLWSTNLVKTGIMRAFGDRLRRAIGRATANRVAACLVGAGVATALQSSTGSSLLVMTFLERGFLSLATALAVLLGTNIGTTLVVQLLSFDLGAVMPVLIILGAIANLGARAPMLRNVGRVALGLGLMIMSLHLVTELAEPLRSNNVVGLVFQQLESEPVLAVIIAALLAWFVHSSVAIVLLIMSLAGAGVIDVGVGLALVLGANLGSSLAPLALSLRGPVEVRQALTGNLLTRVVSVLLVLPFLALIQPALAALEADAGRQVADFHTAFNVAVAIVFLPFVAWTARLLTKMMAPAPAALGEQPLAMLDEGDFDRPSVALVAASREVIRLAELVETMLRETISTFETDDETRRRQISQLDSRIDLLQEGIKLYLTRLTRTPLDEVTSRKAFDLILFTTNLEHVGDILDKTLLELAAKKQRLGLNFSDEGWREIRTMHREAVDQMRLAITVFMTQDADLARRLVEAKDRIRGVERSAAESHLQRLKAGTLASIETSSLHLDIIRDLKRIVAHLTSVAYPILEADGQIATSRLKTKEGAG